MQRIGDSTTTANGAKEFTQGLPGSGVDATIITVEWLNAIQREIVNVLVGAGLAVTPADDSQILKAIKAIILSSFQARTTLAGYGITDAMLSTPQAGVVGKISDILKHSIGVYASGTTDGPPASNGGLFLRMKYPGATSQVAFDIFGHVGNGYDIFGFRRVLADGSSTHRTVFHDGNFDPALKAPLANPTFTGTVTVPNVAAGTSDWRAANTAFVQTAIANLVGSSPAALDTLNELATALGNDPNFAATMTNALAGKAAKATTLAGYGITDGPPRGEVIYFPASTPPEGFLKANGALISRTTYAGLFSVIGTAFGVGNGSTTFALPDLRGEFIRGWDDSRGVNVGRGINTSELDALQGHYHSTPPGGLNFIGSGSGIGSQLTSNGTGNVGFASTGSPVSDGTNGAPRIASETRPRNVALLACIRF